MSETQNHPIHALATVKWKDKRESRKSMPPPNSTHFAATARFMDDDDLALFSIVLYYSPPRSHEEKLSHEVKIRFLAPGIVLPKLTSDTLLYITDGIKVIAEARIYKVFPAEG